MSAYPSSGPFGSGAQPPVPGVSPPPSGLPPAVGLPPSGAFPPPGGAFPPPGGAFPPPQGGFAPPKVRRGSSFRGGAGLIGGYLGVRLLIWGISSIVSLAIFAAVFFFGIGGSDAPLSDVDRSPYQAPTTAPLTVPAGWPEGLAPPAGAEVTSAIVTSGGTPQEQVVLRWSVTGDLAAQVATVRQQVEATGFTLVSEPGGSDTTQSFVATGATQQVAVTVTTVATPPGQVEVGWVLGPKA